MAASKLLLVASSFVPALGAMLCHDSERPSKYQRHIALVILFVIEIVRLLVVLSASFILSYHIVAGRPDQA
jgi:hypothetical protein